MFRLLIGSEDVVVCCFDMIDYSMCTTNTVTCISQSKTGLFQGAPILHRLQHTSEIVMTCLGLHNLLCGIIWFQCYSHTLASDARCNHFWVPLCISNASAGQHNSFVRCAEHIKPIFKWARHDVQFFTSTWQLRNMRGNDTTKVQLFSQQAFAVHWRCNSWISHLLASNICSTSRKTIRANRSPMTIQEHVQPSLSIWAWRPIVSQQSQCSLFECLRRGRLHPAENHSIQLVPHANSIWHMPCAPALGTKWKHTKINELHLLVNPSKPRFPLLQLNAFIATGDPSSPHTFAPPYDEHGLEPVVPWS